MDVSQYQFDAFTKAFFHHSERKSLEQGTLLVPGGGCVYWRAKKGEACTFCSFPQFTQTLNGANSDSYKSWVLEDKAYISMLNHYKHMFANCHRLAIFNGGSYFPRSELPKPFQDYVLDYVAQHAYLNELLVECYPSFMHKGDIEEAVNRLNGKQLIVGIGFESHDDYIRNQLLNKGISKEVFEQKVKMLQDLGVKVYVYVFLKAPGISEHRALYEALSSIRYLVDLGVDEIALSCAFVSEKTPLEKAYQDGSYTPPTLWTIAEILHQAKKHGWPLSLGGFDDTPPPIAIPSNCDCCNSEIYELLERYRVKGIFDINSLPICGCKNSWLENKQLHIASIG